jgi:hypothetical protein
MGRPDRSPWHCHRLVFKERGGATWVNRFLLRDLCLFIFGAGVAFTSKMVNPKVAINSKYMFQKIFGDGDFIAAGQLIIPPGEKKPAKPTKDNTYVRVPFVEIKHVSYTILQIFYLIEGAVQFKVHRSSFILATGGMFMVPRGKSICMKFWIDLQIGPSNREPVLHREYLSTGREAFLCSSPEDTGGRG